MSLLKTKVKSLCLEEGCDKFATVKGYCPRHYRWHKNTGIGCLVAECDRQHESKGYCGKHYWRWRKYGDPHFVKTNHGEGRNFEEKFWSRVNKTPGLGRDGDCWEWTGKALRKGYAHTRYLGKAQLVHRVSWHLKHGEFPVNFLLHSCDNRRCVNPDHLREGTLQDNTHDMVSRNRQARGEKAGNATLTEDIVKAILAEPKRWGFQSKLATRFNINTGTVSRIRRGLSWKHISI